ncbi:MAG TPA: hypothetical protein VJ249_11430 [Candidatus Bathyarchaeia archaeon]|nr:hypothetical protein [Candidatus Bathyarchaeia archaeon]
MSERVIAVTRVRRKKQDGFGFELGEKFLLWTNKRMMVFDPKLLKYAGLGAITWLAIPSVMQATRDFEDKLRRLTPEELEINAIETIEYEKIQDISVETRLMALHMKVKVGEIERVFGFIEPKKKEILEAIIKRTMPQARIATEEVKRHLSGKPDYSKTPKTFLKKCTECEEEIPIASEICPRCGQKQGQKKG